MEFRIQSPSYYKSDAEEMFFRDWWNKIKITEMNYTKIWKEMRVLCMNLFHPHTPNENKKQ